MKTIVITGGIGSGKSEVCRYLAERGVPVYDADSRTKSLYDTDPELVGSIENALCADGESLRGADGRLDRKRLASIIFSDYRKMAILESIVHPAVFRDFVTWRDQQSSGTVVLESAIFPDKELFHPLADSVIVVECPLESRILRAMKRDGASRTEIEKRVRAQAHSEIHLGEKVRVVTLVNDGSLEELHQKVDLVWDELI